MNEIIQTILIFVALGLALSFLIKKFFWKKPKSKTAFGNQHDCDSCHSIQITQVWYYPENGF